LCSEILSRKKLEDSEIKIIVGRERRSFVEEREEISNREPMESENS
jgi:hypothetical protein